ncbi:MAG: NYN domain-containing protein [Thalassotalea sp.]|nr:NYN domain-containing protein [Thalassotalea sp.]
MKESAAIFVDVQNIYYTCRQAFGRQFNYRALWQQLSEQYDIQLANAYAIQRSDDQQHKFQSALKHIGFDVKLKPFIQRSDGSVKGDWDVGITIDIMEAAPNVDHIILLSGDGDFELLIRHIKNKYQVSTQAFGVEQLTANALMNAVDSFTAIDDNLLQ